MKEIKQITALQNTINNFDSLVSLIKCGEVPALTPYIASKKLLKRLEQFDKEIRENALEEASRYESKFTFDGVEVEYRQGAGRYSYSHDEEWAALKEQENKIAELRKQREELMKTALRTQGELVVDGEIIPPAKVSYNQDSLIVK